MKKGILKAKKRAWQAVKGMKRVAKRSQKRKDDLAGWGISPDRDVDPDGNEGNGGEEGD